MRLDKRIVSVILVIGLIFTNMAVTQKVAAQDVLQQVDMENETTEVEEECSSGDDLEEEITSVEEPSSEEPSEGITAPGDDGENETSSNEKPSSDENPSCERPSSMPPIMTTPSGNPSDGLQPTTSTKAPANSTDSTIAESEKGSLKVVTINFAKVKKKKLKATVYSESDYKNTEKIKIKVTIQRKKQGKWKKYKTYTTTKTSNIAYISKKLVARKKGTYRMNVKVYVYDKNNKKITYNKKSKSIKI